ncbi:uncharacterized protein LOC112083036 [Eutrema salsugineum]|uniref:uncharacterized protein LOC112083036 n=1 Tax=Eutrema salsugineum TaxID=72664 RepID=UPI000CED7641|nr:uncharacterized protein LOC112083036 [Eutrema salsugineum]
MYIYDPLVGKDLDQEKSKGSSQLEKVVATTNAGGRVSLPRESKSVHRFVQPTSSSSPQMFSSSQMITVLVKLQDKEEEFLCSFVYGSNFADDRRELWDDLRSHFSSPIYRRMRWLVMGDFNEILSIDEHSGDGEGSVSASGMWDFQDLVREADLSDMGFHGPCFTWCNKREEGLICKKLDRLLMNDHWLDNNSNSYCVFEAGGGSDHLRCRFYVDGEMTRKKRPFKFTNVIAKLPEFQTALQGLDDSPVSFNLCLEQHLQNPTAISQREESEAFKQWEHSSNLEERYLAQKSKLNWLNASDKNTKVYHRAMKIREIRNGIRELQLQDGTMVMGSMEIKAEAANHFNSFLNHHPTNIHQVSIDEIRDLIDYRCSPVDQQNLVAEVTESEIKAVLFSLAANKSPGPDGYTVEFFKECWPIIGKDMVVGIQFFFLKGFLPKGVNSTILALIPKKEQAKHMKDYRPIACCNVIYKIILKILANRLKVILSLFIAPNQSAFVQDRLLMENLLLASELVSGYDRNTISSTCALKIDISKAFDSVEWSFILTVLEALDLPQAFVHWIRLCISTASFSVQVNGELSGYFGGSRGLRQGCSLSPYLFVICMSVLSYKLDKAAMARRFGFHPRCSNLKLTHLCFADDLMIFSDGKLRWMEGILHVFEEFSTMSGLQISAEKSTAYMAGVSDATRQDIRQRFSFEIGTLPVRYLGLPLLTKQMRSLDYSPLIDKIRSRFNTWTARSLTFAGRLQLLSSAKEEGGLGLKNLSIANEVCILKLVWRLMTASQSLWVQWVRSSLMRGNSIWLTPSPTNQSPGSWMWKQILRSRELAEEFVKVEVHNGQQTLFWYDKWSSMGNLLSIFGARGCVDLGIPHNSTMEEVILTRRRRHRNSMLNQVEDAIDVVKQRYQAAESDVFLWKSKDTSYKSIFSTRATRTQLTQHNPKVSWAKGIWFKHHHPKFNFITWLALLNRLSTGDRMQTWSSNAHAGCTFCNDPLETRDHLFFTCSYSARIWSKLSRGILQHDYTVEWNALVNRISCTQRNLEDSFIIRYLFQHTIYAIWRERNARRHGSPPTEWLRMVKLIDKGVRNRFSSIRLLGDTKYEGGLQRWFATISLST